MVIVLLIVIGLCLGSFVNALVWRLHEQMTKKNSQQADLSILTGRSMCPHCHHPLAVQDLMPVLSWLWLRGKCRYCGQVIAWQYPFIELLVPSLFIISYLGWPAGFHPVGIFSFICWLTFLTAFVALSVYDLRWFLLPDRIVFPLIGLAVVELMLRATIFGGGWQVIMQAGWGVLFIAGLFYLLYMVSKGTWIGFGDVKLAVVLGIVVGGPLAALMLIFIASLLGSVVSAPLLLQGKAKATSHIPFGPFLLVAAVVVVLFGGHITDWYRGLFYLP